MTDSTSIMVSTQFPFPMTPGYRCPPVPGASFAPDGHASHCADQEQDRPRGHVIPS
jgi:hypothetical protein